MIALPININELSRQREDILLSAQCCHQLEQGMHCYSQWPSCVYEACDDLYKSVIPLEPFNSGYQWLNMAPWR